MVRFIPAKWELTAPTQAKLNVLLQDSSYALEEASAPNPNGCSDAGSDFYKFECIVTVLLASNQSIAGTPDLGVYQIFVQSAVNQQSLAYLVYKSNGGWEALLHAAEDLEEALDTAEDLALLDAYTTGGSGGCGVSYV